ncbi:cation channel sperm-associated protein 3-like isoform X2 [Oscarella lobularis]
MEANASDESPTKRRPDERLHNIIQYVTSSSAFNGFIMFIIFLNAITIALETSSSLKDSNPKVFKIIDILFFAIYSLEFLLKVYAEPKNYWKNPYNLFDLSILILLMVQVILDEVRPDQEEQSLDALKVVKALRALRALRSISFIRGLQVLVSALISTFRTAVVDLILLLLLIMFLFAVMGFYFFGYDETGDKKNWGNLGQSMLSLFTLVTVDGWTDIQDSLDEKISPYTRFFTTAFIFLGHFIFTNLFIAVVISNIHTTTSRFEEERRQERIAVLEEKKHYLRKRQHDEVVKLMEKQKAGHYANFADMTKGFRESLRHDEIVCATDVSANVQWIETFLTSLDHHENSMYRCQMLHFEIANTLKALKESIQ